LSELDGACLGLLLLHVGPNGDVFGGQAFMEHYIDYLVEHIAVGMCKGNITVLRRILYSDLAKGNPK
jgi:hypothetical protein